MRKIILILLFVASGVFSAFAQSRLSENSFVDTKQIKFYHNHATTFIQFDFSDDILKSGASFRIYNFIGKKVYETNQLNTRTVVNLNEFFRGMYIFQLTDRMGRVIESSKFQVLK
ncbi:MAG: T9SS type A sorting domain-containing protein [Bacteroidota bacterium]